MENKLPDLAALVAKQETILEPIFSLYFLDIADCKLLLVIEQCTDTSFYFSFF